MQNVAVSDSIGKIELWFPEKDTWLGTIVAKNAQNLAEDYNLQKISVSLTTLDAYTEKTGLKPDLIKIDTEGNELNVLKGALNTLKNIKPLVIFESNQTVDAEEKEKIYDFFEKLNFLVIALPLLPGVKHTYVTLNQFQSTPEGNFLAVHDTHNLIKAQN